jgi:hypothetical protein
MSSVGRVMFLFCCIGGFVLIASTARTATVKTNLEVMREVTTEVLEELVSEFPGGDIARELRLAPMGHDERHDFIGDILAQTLTEKGYRAYLPMAWSPADTSQSSVSNESGRGWEGLKVEYKVIDFTLRYPTIYRAHLIGGKKVKRTADVNVSARLVDPADGLVVWTGEASKSYEDTFSYGEIEEAEAGSYEFTKPPRESRQWGKIIEPVVVSGIIVGLIYLFFSNQGD